MTRLVNAAPEFAIEALAGFAATQSDRVLLVPGGVVRATRSPGGQVAVVMGGGSGHFPAFAGWIGVGFGHGAACGNIFASPSEGQILRVARAADNGGGVLFTPINYAGDILHFTAAAQQLRTEGIDARLVPITDDIASGSTEERARRRGIAGSFIVLKIVGAKAEEGASLDDVERVAILANEATRSFGVAFSGCTLPGSSEPLFQVPEGRVAVGLGIHGEPGISETALGSADEVADLLVDGLFAERQPEPGRAVAVLVNGLGSTKYDELFVVFGRIRARVEQEGMRLVAPVVGEQVTSLDMAGLSVSLCYLDEELEPLWLAAADAASFSRGATGVRELRTVDHEDAGGDGVVPGSEASRVVGMLLAGFFDAARELLEKEESRLGTIDAVAGDGDHGIGMHRGATAAAFAASSAVEAGAGAGTVLRVAGEAWSESAGGASGALWGAGLAAAGLAVGDESALGVGDIARAARAFSDEIVQRGGASLGEKTMVDALLPFVATLELAAERDQPISVAWRSAADAATRAAEATARIVSSRGRSRLHGEKSLGTPDAGATSFALLVRAMTP